MVKEFVSSRETLYLRGAIGNLIGDLERLSSEIYAAKTPQLSGIRPGLDIRQLREYTEAVVAISALRETAARKYHEQNNIPL